MVALLLALGAGACASAPPAPAVPAEPSYQQKMAWMLRLEDSRTLRDPAPVEAPPPPTPVSTRRATAVAPAPPPPPVPDLVRLLADRESRTRRRAALAIGRVGHTDGVAPLVSALTDSEPEVRQMAAFALGLIGSRDAFDPLVAALADPSPVVKGSAAEALGLIGAPAAAAPIARMASAVLASGALATLPSDEFEAARTTEPAAFRQAVYALARLKDYDALAGVVLDAAGQPRVRWWPVAYALQRLEDPRALPALLALAKDPHPYTRAFAAKGLGALARPTSAPALVPLLDDGSRSVVIEAVRSLGRLRFTPAAEPLLGLLRSPKTDPQVRLEIVSAIGGLKASGVFDALIDLVGDKSIPVRGATLRSLAQLDPEGFVTVLSGLDSDPNWNVRAALATALGTLPAEFGFPRLQLMLSDEDARVLPAVVNALAKLGIPEAGPLVVAQLKSADPVVRAAAANAVAALKPTAGPPALMDAYQRSLTDTTYVARAAVLSALRAYGAETATPLLTDALGDKDWALRLRAAQLLDELDPSARARARIRPAPGVRPTEWYERPSLVNPAVSTHAFIETDKGTIEIEFAVLDAPLTVDNFVTLAKRGFFDGLPVHRVVPNYVIQGGDPRGDSEGSPGFTIRDEINQALYLRGALGMALDWADTGGSQFFITHSPQPHLDAKYTVFGRVVEGMDVVDRIEPWDVIRRVRIWDGTTN